MGCELCGGGDLWIKTCLTPYGTRLRVCDLCYEEHASELVIVPGDSVVTARCDECWSYANPRKFVEVHPGGRKDAYSGICGACKPRGEEDTIQRGDSTLTIIVPEEVLEGLEAVRESGAVNMLSRMDVVVAAHYFGYPAARDWVAEPENFEVYARGVFEGFEAEVE